MILTQREAFELLTLVESAPAGSVSDDLEQRLIDAAYAEEVRG